MNHVIVVCYVKGLVADVITGDKFCRDLLRGFRSVGVRKWGSPIDLDSRNYNKSALYRAACDCCFKAMNISLTSVLSAIE